MRLLSVILFPTCRMLRLALTFFLFPQLRLHFAVGVHNYPESQRGKRLITASPLSLPSSLHKVEPRLAVSLRTAHLRLPCGFSVRGFFLFLSRGSGVLLNTSQPPRHPQSNTGSPECRFARPVPPRSVSFSRYSFRTSLFFLTQASPIPAFNL